MAAVLALALGCNLASAQSASVPGSGSGICTEELDDDGAIKPVPFWKRFAFEGACVELSGSLGVTYQKQKAKAGVSSILTTRQGTVTGASEVKSFSADFRIDTARRTGIGELKTVFGLRYDKSSTDSGNGFVTLSEAAFKWGGAKGGYTGSQMNFWSGNFQFSANAPQRTIGMAGYDLRLSEAWSLGLAYETGLPTSQSSGTDFAAIYPDDPAGSALLSYEAGKVAFVFGGLIHELQISGSNPLLTALGRQQGYNALGWVLTSGLRLPGPVGEATAVSSTSRQPMRSTRPPIWVPMPISPPWRARWRCRSRPKAGVRSAPIVWC